MLIVSRQKSSKYFGKTLLIFLSILLICSTLVVLYQVQIKNHLRENIIIRTMIKSYGLGGVDRTVSILKVVDNLISNLSDFIFFQHKDAEKVRPIVLDLKFKQFKNLEKSRIRALSEGFIYHGHPKVKGIIKFPGNKDEVKLRLKGYQLDHLATNKWSLKIELKDSSFDGIQKFSLQAPHTKDFHSAPVIQEAMRIREILAPRDGYVNLTINGKNIGLMYFEEDINEQLTEASNLPYGPIFKFDEKANKISFEDKKLFWLNDPVQQFIGGKIENIIQKPMKYIHLIDLDKWAEYLSITFLFKCFHGNIDFNLSYYFHPLNRMLEPISTDHSCGQKEDHRPLGFLPVGSEFVHKLLESENFQIILEKKIIWWINNPSAQKLLIQFNKKSSYLKALVAQEAPFIGDFKIKNSHLGEVLKWIKGLKHEPKFIDKKNKIQPSPLQAKFVPTLLVKRNSNLFQAILYPFQKDTIQLYEMSLKVAQVKTIYPINNKTNSDEITRILNDNLKLRDLKSMPKIKLNYFELGKKKYKKTINPHFAYINSDVNLFEYTKASTIANYFKYDIEENTFYIEEDTYKYINQTIIFPKDVNVKIGAGSTLDFSDNTGLIINGSLVVSGKKDRKVMLKGGESSNWAGIQINGFKSQSIINNLIVDGGNGIFAGLSNRGAFTINNSSFEIRDSLFQNNQSEDTLNLSNVKGSLDNVIIQNTKSDALDIDFSKVKMSNSRFSNVGSTTGADAIDISKSHLVADNIEITNVTDKGVSVGESSKATINNIIISDTLVGIVAKDSSHLIANNIVMHNIFMANTMVYNKKQNFSGAILEMKNIDDHSGIHIAEHGSTLIIEGVKRKTQKINIKKLYATKMKSVK